MTPLQGAAQLRTAKKVGFAKTESLHSLRIEGPDKPGLCSLLTTALAQAGISLRGLSAAAMGKNCIMHLALDTATDAAKALRMLKKC